MLALAGDATMASANAGLRRRCSLAFSSSAMLVDILRDTALLVGSDFRTQKGSEASGRQYGGVYADTPMPGARVRLRRLDTGTRERLRLLGVTDSVPVAYLKAMPYSMDCAAMRWHDTVPWVRPGTGGYVSSTILLDSSRWIGGAPVFMVMHPDAYPYPQRRTMFGVSPESRDLVSPEILFEFDSMQACCAPSAYPRNVEEAERLVRERDRSMERWLRAHPMEIEQAPLRTILRAQLLARVGWRTLVDSLAIAGTYRVRVRVQDTTYTWMLRTEAGAGERLDAADSGRTTRELLDAPRVSGFVLRGIAARDSSALMDSMSRYTPSNRYLRFDLSAIHVAPSRPHQQQVRAEMRFELRAAPPALWQTLQPFLADQSGTSDPSGHQEAVLPLTLQRGTGAAWRGHSAWHLRTLTLDVHVDQVSRRELTIYDRPATREHP